MKAIQIVTGSGTVQFAKIKGNQVWYVRWASSKNTTKFGPWKPSESETNPELSMYGTVVTIDPKSSK